MKTDSKEILLPWLDYYMSVKEMLNHSIILSGYVVENFGRLQNHLSGFIRRQRKAGAHWVFDMGEVSGEDGKVRLPMINLCGYLNLDSNNDLERFFSDRGINSGIVWDTEHSGWYPIFNTNEDAFNCIANLDKMFDEFYLENCEPSKNS